jgi:ABC-type uncharacterized transport system substrate-binding protein
MSAELSAKRLQLLKEAVPSLKRAAMLYNADDAGMVTRYKAASAVAPKLGVTLESFGVREPDDFGSAFDKMAAAPPDGILMVTPGREASLFRLGRNLEFRPFFFLLATSPAITRRGSRRRHRRPGR